MKKLLSSLAVFAILAAGLRADEGMWLLPLLQKMNAEAMADLGCRLTPEQIYSINNSSLKDAVVHFGAGCTGEVISNEGLLVTNHHCGYSSIQELSSPEHNYLEDGYWAMTRDKELPVPGLSVTFLESMTDVTEIVETAREAALKSYSGEDDPEAVAADAVEVTKQMLIETAKADNPGCRVIISGFYNDNIHYLIVYKDYTDIRFVGAPPVSLGKFGGNTDNWEWPRHTCDFSIFRIYAGKDNEPADYSEDNVPYVPKKALKISLKGLEDGDFAMVIGYPGRTQRYQTAAQLESMMNMYGIAVKARTVRQDEMLKSMESDPVLRLKYANKYASSTNYWKKWQGEQLAFDKLKVIERQQEKEAAFTKWVNSNKKRTQKYGTALSDISEAMAKQRTPYHDLYLLSESVYKIGPVGVASYFVSGHDACDDSLLAVSVGLDAAREALKDYDVQTEKNIAVALLEFFRDNARKEMYLEGIGDFENMDFKAYVDELFEKSVFASSENLDKAEGMTMEELKNDPAMVLWNSIMQKRSVLSPDVVATSDQLARGTKAYAAGLLEWNKGKASYPDANSTMRLTYGNVKSYSPKDGVLYKHYTTLKGVMEKEDPDNYEFRVPAKLKELYEAKDYGQYANKDGELPTCFLSNCDITGGNSGSPVLNADGDLVGLAFDGNWESMSGDVIFEPDLQRCISVDIRYVMFVVDKFGGAGHLIKEMELVK
jgi:hypothetical protein